MGGRIAGKKDVGDLLPRLVSYHHGINLSLRCSDTPFMSITPSHVPNKVLRGEKIPFW